MGKPRDISHADIVAYIRGECDSQVQQFIERKRESNTVYQLLFQLVERTQTRADTTMAPDKIKQPALSFSRTEQLLERLFSGDFTGEDAQLFYDGLISSPVFYKRLLDRLQFAVPQLSQTPDPDLAKVKMKSDEDVLTEVLDISAQETETEEIASERKTSFSLSTIFGSLKNLIKIPAPSPRLALVLSGVSAVIILFILGYNSIFRTDGSYSYLPDNRVPYEYDSSSFRGTEADLKTADDPLLFSFIRDFKNGIGYYMVQEYESAIYIFENLETAVARLESKNIEAEYYSYFRDLFFFNGMSHLALFSRKETLKEYKTNHLSAAMNSLERAAALVSKYNLENPDREAYYLGMAYGMAGRYEIAIVQLSSVTAESQFFGESQKLLDKWKN